MHICSVMQLVGGLLIKRCFCYFLFGNEVGLISRGRDEGAV
ncbi:hypothetical protein SLEP1_g42047 [Rubroshorea leprosula]|uniref:Uncharacterized protein n=1 Tax=Rubroshorea leprosula TaxID=152421 RepID=A0AAV5L8H3_9ROSI|nr:hypothetical protein SLEP1_g42047 [Rubroshorea leprosula]